MPARKKDFFISYNKADRGWAEWIAWVLEEAGYTTVLQAWDFRPGGNFILKMQEATSGTTRTLAVLSPDYLKSLYTQPEWAAALAGDPTGAKRRLIGVRVRRCKLEGLLPQIIYIDLLGLGEDAAKEALLSGVKEGRAKPKTAPRFPGKSERSVPKHPKFPAGEKASSPKTLPPAAAGKTKAATPPKRASGTIVKSTGDLVLLRNRLYTARPVVERQDGSVSLTIKSTGTEDDAALRALRPGEWGRGEPVPYAHQNTGFIARVKSCDRESGAGRATWTVILEPERRREMSGFGASNYGLGGRHFTADDLAELRARWLLLDEEPKLPGPGRDQHLAMFVSGGSDVKGGIFPLLWQAFEGTQDRFLRFAHLWAVFNLLTSGTCEYVLELALGPIQANKMKVRFRGKRAERYGEPGATIRVEGSCVLGGRGKRQTSAAR